MYRESVKEGFNCSISFDYDLNICFTTNFITRIENCQYPIKDIQ
jgi:hypothetical protein